MIAAHLALVPTSRNNGHGRAYRLNENGMPTHDGSPESTHAIVRWLNVEKSERYRPSGGTTFCNIYAVDLCHIMGAYLPRVWWGSKALAQIAAGEQPVAVYAANVGELSANALFRWLTQHSEAFGWQRVENLDEAQDAANRGRAVVLCARRVVEAAPGHISCIVPESERCAAKRDLHGRVTVPVQSQAGGRNIEVGLTGTWWRGTEMAECGLWVHDPLNVADTDPAPPPDSDAITSPGTPTSKSSERLAAVDAPILDWSPQTDARPFLETLVDEGEDES